MERDPRARAAPRPGNDNDCHSAGEDAAASAIALAAGRPAGVTLRLDPARHLRLRLACALEGRSAEALLVRALDAHLKTIEGLERLAAATPTECGAAASTWGDR